MTKYPVYVFSPETENMNASRVYTCNDRTELTQAIGAILRNGHRFEDIVAFEAGTHRTITINLS